MWNTEVHQKNDRGLHKRKIDHRHFFFLLCYLSICIWHNSIKHRMPDFFLDMFLPHPRLCTPFSILRGEGGSPGQQAKRRGCYAPSSKVLPIVIVRSSQAGALHATLSRTNGISPRINSQSIPPLSPLFTMPDSMEKDDPWLAIYLWIWLCFTRELFFME